VAFNAACNGGVKPIPYEHILIVPLYIFAPRKIECAMPHLCLVDGSGFIFRAFHALPPMSRADGTPVNAVYGFTAMLMKLAEDIGADHIAVIFDTARKTFRNDLYADYKAHRPPPPEELIPQFPLVREAVHAMNMTCLEKEGFEADDIIATYATAAGAVGTRVTIVSSDKDLMQLVTDNVQMYDSMKNKWIGPDEVVEKFGVAPAKVVDVQALAGDSVDNVPGVPGIGIKTAAELINTFGDLDALLDQASTIKQPKRRERLMENAEMARISRQLVQLDCVVPDLPTWDALSYTGAEPDRLLEFLQVQGFRSLQNKVKGAAAAVARTDAPAPEKIDASYELVTTPTQLQNWIDKCFEAGIVAVDTETNSLDARHAKLVGICLSTAAGEGCYIPVGHVSSAGDGAFDFDGDAADIAQLPKADVLAALAPMLRHPGVLKVGHNFKYDLHVLRQDGIVVTPYDDTMVMSYVLDGSSHGHGMDELAKRHLEYTPVAYADVCGTGKKQITFDQVPLEKALYYAAEDADITLRLHCLLKQRLRRSGLMAVYEYMDRPLIGILLDMESKGIQVDGSILSRLSDDFAARLAVLEDEIHALAGEEFNIASPKQLGEILFGKMGLPGGKKSKKTGAYSTSADVLEKLAGEGHDLPKQVLEYRQFAKLKSTYTDALQKDIEKPANRVHTSYSQVGTSTGRLSSNDPNLQNIPIRSKEGREIRTAFVAKPGHKLISADYSQIELRLMAHVAGVSALQDAFKNGADIHAATASHVFGVPIEGMDPMVRRQAKAINFGIIYGISAFGLARQLDMSRTEAQATIDAYFAQYPEIKTYMAETVEYAKAHGYVMTPFGRKCHVNGINDKNQQMRNFGERAAINAPIQGGAADIIKKAMITLPQALADAGLAAEMLLQVHDELIFEVPDAEVDATKALVVDVMENAADLSVRMEVDAGVGESWADAH
jgi:DNA polymerase-1